jgi:hypothetical protein
MITAHCNEKGMRLESATVPAAVKPDHALRDDGFVKYLPLSRFRGMGRLQKTGISQKTCQRYLLFKAFGKKSQDHTLIPHLNFLVSTEYRTKNNCRGFTILKCAEKKRKKYYSLSEIYHILYGSLSFFSFNGTILNRL